MPNMKRFIEHQQAVFDADDHPREISAKRKAIVSDYSRAWDEMIRQWRAPRANDAVWLTYSANYLFNTRGLKWAVDPVLLSNRVPEAPGDDRGGDLQDLDFILLSHAHADHVDVDLWSQLAGAHSHWIVPEYMIECFSRSVPRDVLYSSPIPGRRLEIAGARITPFEAPHDERTAGGDTRHVPSTGYWVETTGGNYLLPGDIRTYDPTCLKPFLPVSAVFAHVFLGRSAALAAHPPLAEAFVDFYRFCRPKKIVLAHLYEFGRDPEDCWISAHARMVETRCHAVDPGIEMTTPEWFQETSL